MPLLLNAQQIRGTNSKTVLILFLRCNNVSYSYTLQMQFTVPSKQQNEIKCKRVNSLPPDEGLTCESLIPIMLVNFDYFT